MSNVQLSSVAIMERLVARRTFPLHKRTGVCRNLFGPVDHDELSREMKAKLREISERDQQKWNFNFEANAPLDGGDYQWEELPVDTTPGFYQDKLRSAAPGETPGKTDSDPECAERLTAPESSSGGGTGATGEVNQENRMSNSGRSAQHRGCVRHKRPASTDDNTRITDFFVKRKKVVERKAGDLCLLSKIPVEQTPRKRIR